MTHSAEHNPQHLRQQKQQNRKTFYATHTWLGIICGIVLFVVVFSGFPAMFAQELEVWQSPALSQLSSQQNTEGSTTPPSFDPQRLILAARENGFLHNEFSMAPMTDYGYAVIAHFDAEPEADIRYFDLFQYQQLDIGESDMAHTLEHLHTDLHLPRPFGRYLVGLAGMVMLLSIIAGIVIHNKWRKEFVMLRPKRSWRLLLTDQHKLIGLWTLPFSFILAFSGTILGLLGVISPILALAKFDGDVEKATIAVLGPRAEVVGQPTPSQSINPLLIKAQQQQPDMQLSRISVEGYGDKGGVIVFAGENKNKLSSLQSVTYRLEDGAMVHELDGGEKGPFQRIFASIVPLHYVLFGDMALKVFYAISTLALCALIVSGNMIWLAKKKQGQSTPDNQPHLLARSTLGICAGLVVTTAATLAASQWLAGVSLGYSQGTLETAVFWTVWLLATVYALVGQDLHHKSRMYLLATGVLLISAVVGNGVIHQRFIWSGSGLIVGIHLTLVSLALVCGWFAWRLPEPRSKKHSNRSDQHAEKSADNPPVQDAA